MTRLAPLRIGLSATETCRSVIFSVSVMNLYEVGKALSGDAWQSGVTIAVSR